jgi:hypothetical protein
VKSPPASSHNVDRDDIHGEQKKESFDSVWSREKRIQRRPSSERIQWMEHDQVTPSCAPRKEGIRKVFGVAAERKQKRNEGEKGDGSAVTRRRSEDPFSFRAGNTLTDA